MTPTSYAVFASSVSTGGAYFDPALFCASPVGSTALAGRIEPIYIHSTVFSYSTEAATCQDLQRNGSANLRLAAQTRRRCGDRPRRATMHRIRQALSVRGLPTFGRSNTGLRRAAAANAEPDRPKLVGDHSEHPCGTHNSREKGCYVDEIDIGRRLALMRGYPSPLSSPAGRSRAPLITRQIST